MRVLVACEFSGVVRDAMRDQGHDAWSCDLLPTESPGPHYQCDARDVIGDGWDLIIAHPPCTYLCNSGVHWLNREEGRWDKMREAARFFRELLDAPAPRVAVENPIPHRYAVEIMGRKYDQIIHPWQFGHPESKATCLWLRGLPPLAPTRVLEKPASGRWANQTPSGQNKLGPSEDRWKLRSVTYDGIARAMAVQWGDLPAPSPEWKEVVFAADCDEDGACPKCAADYAECDCPGPTQDGYEYLEFEGKLYARPIGGQS